MSESVALARPRSTRWWKIAFVIAFLAFEVMRELYVLKINEPPNFIIGDALSYRSADGSFVTAQGRWQRTDFGKSMDPDSVRIECDKAIASCIMAETSEFAGGITIPDITREPATFTTTGAEFTDDSPGCSHLFVRIDGVHNATTATWTPTGNPAPACKSYERVDLRLAGWDPPPDPMSGHFVPVLQLLGVLFQALAAFIRLF